MGTIIKMSMGQGVYISRHDYGDCHIQGGTKGIVLGNKNEPGYRTAFVEVFPPKSFIRGEGATIEEADEDCWKKFQAFMSCDHQYEPRNYTNGGGICAHCKQFGSKVFTGEELNQLCNECGIGTLENHIKETKKWYCSEHYPLKDYSKLYYAIYMADHIYRIGDSNKYDYCDQPDVEFQINTAKLRDIISQSHPADLELLQYFGQFSIE